MTNRSGRDLPPGWVDTTLGDVTADVVEQGSPEGTGTFVYVDISSIDNSTKCIGAPKELPVTAAPSRARQKLKSGDVVVSMTRPNLNAVAQIPPALDGTTGSTGLHVLRPILVESGWLCYLVQTDAFIHAMSGRIQGVMYPAIRPRDIEAFSFPLPPLAEQQRIVGEVEKHLTRLDAAVGALQRLRANLKRYRASVLEAAVQGRLFPTYDSTGQALPTVKFGDLLESFRSGTVAVPQDVKTELPILRSSSVRQGNVDTSDVRYLRPEVSQVSSELVEDGDLLFVRLSGSLEYVGNCGLVRALGSRRLAFPDRLFRARLKNKELAPYCELAFGSQELRTQIEAAVKSTAGHQRISIGAITQSSMPMPPDEERERIVSEVERRLSIAESLESVVETNLKRAERLRQSVLKRAFEGRLVPQDGEDEPASVLLERIRAERERASPLINKRQPRRRQTAFQPSLLGTRSQ